MLCRTRKPSRSLINLRAQIARREAVIEALHAKGHLTTDAEAELKRLKDSLALLDVTDRSSVANEPKTSLN